MQPVATVNAYHRTMVVKRLLLQEYLTITETVLTLPEGPLLALQA